MVYRSEINQALAKVIVYKICHDHAAAAEWARQLVRHLECTEILNSLDPASPDAYRVSRNNDSTHPQ